MSMPSTEVPDMQPSTLAPCGCLFATIIALMTENSNMSPAPGSGKRMAALPDEPQPEQSATEVRNDRTTEIDTVSTLALLALLNEQDAQVAGAVAAVLPVLAEVVDVPASRLRAGGRVHYFGAGTSGRIGVLDAAEVVPTFGVDHGIFVAHQAGGEDAVRRAVEGAGDKTSLGQQAAAPVTAADVAVGLSASGRTPYVAGAL